MKLKIYQQGGGLVYTPFLTTPYLPGSSDTTTGGSSKSGSKKSSGATGLDDSILKILETNGLPNDYSAFVGQVNDLFQQFANQEMLTGQQVSPMAQLAAMYNLANKVQFNKKAYEDATENLNEQAAWSEVATDANGRMYVQTKDGLETINPTEYDKSKHVALTNSQIMNLRSHASGFEFNSSIINDMASATGMEAVRDHLIETISKFGTTEKGGYTVKKGKQIEDGLKDLIGQGPEGYYQVDAKIQAENREQALKYLYTTLPANMRNLINAKTAAEGKNPKSNDVYTVLWDALSLHTNDSVKAKFDDKATETISGGTTDKGVTGTAQHTRLTQAVTGHDLNTVSFNIKPFQSDVQLTVQGNNLGRFWDFNEKTLPQSNLKTLFTTSELGTVVDSNAISFGDQAISFTDSNGILWDGNNVNRVVLPYKIDREGRKVPNFAAIEKANTLTKYLRDHNNYTPTYINQLIQDTFGGEAYYDSKTNSIKFKNEWVFISFSAYAGEDTVALDDTSKMIKKLSRAEGRKIKTLYNNMTKWGVSLEGKEDKASPIGGQGDSEANDMYQANVFIPLLNENIGYFVNNHSYVPKTDLMDIEPKSQNGKMITNWF